MARHRLVPAALTALALAGAARAQDRLDIAPDTLRGAAVTVLNAGNPVRARTMAEALLHRDAEDRTALSVAMQAALGMEDNAAAAEFGRRLWNRADAPEDRFQVARLTALALARDDRFTAAQLWLRRAAQSAPDEAARAEIATNYRTVRQANPVHWDFGLSLAPSSNVNGGSSADTILLFGVIELELSEDAKALSGWDYMADAKVTWRLSRADRSLTLLGFGLAVDGYWLSDDSRARAPDFDAEDWRLIDADLTLDHRWVPTGTARLAGIQAELSATTLGGDGYANSLTLAHWRDFRLGENDSLHLQAALGRTEYVQSDTLADRAAINLQWTHDWHAGVTALSLGHGEIWSDRDDFSYVSNVIAIDHDFGALTEAVSVSVNLSQEHRDYDTGRTDRTIALGSMLSFDTAEVYGFIPQLSVTARQTESSFDRYDSTTLSTRFSFTSAF
ncbi:MAG: Protein of unknown function (DUF560) [Rhodobacteraceae bacterium HLUCCA08]|nr:MAG: Protein of unknown function (DUF560) [Rhodobacteraceae bacterium HLUCCA08]